MLVAQGFNLRSIRGRVVALVDLVGGEVGYIHVGGQTRFEGGADRSELVPIHSVEEGMLSDVGAAELARGRAETVGGVAEEAAACTIAFS